MMHIMLQQRNSSDVVSSTHSDGPYNAALTCITRVLVCNLSAMCVCTIMHESLAKTMAQNKRLKAKEWRKAMQAVAESEGGEAVELLSEQMICVLASSQEMRANAGHTSVISSASFKGPTSRECTACGKECACM